MRILVAMSGGVDSSAVAGLLHEAGHEVIGVTLQLYDHGAATGRKGACCAGQDIHDARRVADQLGIPHYVIDAEERFADAVIGDFADSYAAGETPVPCVRCNQTVKFADLTALAQGLGCRAAGDRPLCAADRRPGRRRTASRRRSGARSELVPVRHHAARSLRARCFRWAACRTSARCAPRRSGSACRWRPSRTARTSASSRRAAMPMWSRGCGPMRGEPGEIVDRGRPRASAGTTGSRATRSGRASGWARRRWTGGERQVVVATGRRRVGASWSARATPARDLVRLREVNWLVPPPATRCAAR